MDSHQIDTLIKGISSLEHQIRTLTSAITRLTKTFEQYVQMGVHLENAATEKEQHLGEILSNISGKRNSSMWERTEENSTSKPKED